MSRWTFKREAQWMIWLGLAPLFLILSTLGVSWLRRISGW